MSEPLPHTPIDTGRYLLRPFHRRDAESLHQAVMASRPDLARFLPWAHYRYSSLTARRFIRESVRSWREARAYDFAIRTREQPDFHLGNVSIWHVSRNYRSGEIGYWIRTGETGQGIATETAHALLQVGFERLGMHRIVVRIAAGNLASEKVAHKLGFAREGLLRDEIKIGQQWVDHSIWGLLKHEFRPARHPAFP